MTEKSLVYYTLFIPCPINSMRPYQTDLTETIYLKNLRNKHNYSLTQVLQIQERKNQYGSGSKTQKWIPISQHSFSKYERKRERENGTKKINENGSVPDPWHFGVDPDPDPGPDPDPAIFIIDLQDASKKLIFTQFFLLVTVLFEGTFTLFYLKSKIVTK